MTGDAPPSPPSHELAGERYEATIHLRSTATQGVDALTRVSDLDLDRVPDPDGGIRVLINQQEISRLVGQGFEVRLQHAVPVRPLDPVLIFSDEDVDSWYSARMPASGENPVGEDR